MTHVEPLALAVWTAPSTVDPFSPDAPHHTRDAFRASPSLESSLRVDPSTDTMLGQQYTSIGFYMQNELGFERVSQPKIKDARVLSLIRDDPSSGAEDGRAGESRARVRWQDTRPRKRHISVECARHSGAVCGRAGGGARLHGRRGARDFHPWGWRRCGLAVHVVTRARPYNLPLYGGGRGGGRGGGTTILLRPARFASRHLLLELHYQIHYDYSRMHCFVTANIE